MTQCTAVCLQSTYCNFCQVSFFVLWGGGSKQRGRWHDWPQIKSSYAFYDVLLFYGYSNDRSLYLCNACQLLGKLFYKEFNKHLNANCAEWILCCRSLHSNMYIVLHETKNTRDYVRKSARVWWPAQKALLFYLLSLFINVLKENYSKIHLKQNILLDWRW